jgi:multiple sugar transport system permease protein
MQPAVSVNSQANIEKRRKTYRRHDVVLAYFLVAPLVLWLAATILYPLLSAIHLSVLDVKVIGSGGEFVGFANYEQVLTSNRFWAALGRSGVWVISNALLQTIVAFVTALILKQRFRGQRIARIWIILSWIVPTVVVVIIWRWMLGTSGGIVNYLLVALGLIPHPVGFFSSGPGAFAALVLINSWRWFPLTAVILLAGMHGIPEEFYEAAAVDGASGWQRFWKITMPSLQPVLFVLGLVGTLWSVNVFDIIWLLTSGGPSSATTTLPVFIYDTAFKQYNLSRAAAASVLMGVVLLVFAVLFMRFLSPKTDEGARVA